MSYIRLMNPKHGMAALVQRAAGHAALGDPVRLAIIDALSVSDRAPNELGRAVGVASNLLAHHLDTLEAAGLVRRTTSHGDRRRRYVKLVPERLASLRVRPMLAPQPSLFLCSQNSARSQLGAVLWTSITGQPALSAGTHPAARVHPLAEAAASRAGLSLAGARPRALEEIRQWPGLVITVCDQAHEELGPPPEWLHWSLPDPVAHARPAAFDATVRTLRERITHLVGAAAA